MPDRRICIASVAGGPNVVEVDGTTLLLTMTSGGVAVHLTVPAAADAVDREGGRRGGRRDQRIGRGRNWIISWAAWDVG